MLETKPPLFSMMPRSVLGSWSVVNCTAWPFLERTARESPTLAVHNIWPLINIAVTAVDPPRPKSELCERIAWSVFRYAFEIDAAGSSQNAPYDKNKSIRI